MVRIAKIKPVESPTPLPPSAEGWTDQWPTEIGSCWWFHGWLHMGRGIRRTYFVELVGEGVFGPIRCTVHGLGDFVLRGQAKGLWKRAEVPVPSAFAIWGV